MMDYDVTIDREKYIGGSDIAAIMGISPFKTRWELLLEKAGLKEDEFQGNQFTEYGKIIEPQIRDYINEKFGRKFQPNRVINGDIRCHTDGFDRDTILEIKSTSHIYKTVEEYKIYLCQLVKYMEENNCQFGLLAIYHRPEDLNPVFEPSRLHVWQVTIEELICLLGEVNAEIRRFRADLKRLRENPLLTEQDFLSNDLISISKKVVALERRMTEYKSLEAESEEIKRALFDAMTKHNIKSWETPSGIRLTRVDGSAGTTKAIICFDEETFKSENPALYDLYLKESFKTTPARSGYIKITLPF